MRWTRTLIPTLRKAPEGAEIPSHVLMLRAGLARQLMSGAYAYLPLGLGALRKVEKIIRQEMEAAGAVEILLSTLTPLSIWQQTGCTSELGEELIGFSLRRHNRQAQIALAPAHDALALDLISRQVSSYRQLPITVYQIQTKYRNEARPRLGALRTNEFSTADAFSFETSAEALGESYERMYAACLRILERCGLKCLAVEAESPAGGNLAGHELMVPAGTGEHVAVRCRECGYAANLERAEIGPLGGSPSDVALEPVRKVDTPDARTIEQVSAMLGCKPAEMIKTLIYTADGNPVAVLVRGDHEANEVKIRRALGAQTLQMAPPDVIQRVTGAPVGFAGPVGMREKTPVWADRAVRFARNAVTGANQPDAHLTGVNPDRDYHVDRFADLRIAVAGDPCPRCSSRLELQRAIKVGRLSKPGARYSEALGAQFVDHREQQRPIMVGSYQIGINRVVAALVETSHDARGIVWPVTVTPYEVLVMPLNVTDAETMTVAGRLHDELTGAGIDVLLDDRAQSPGVKFNDADLVGIPLRVVIGSRGLESGHVEIRWRWNAVAEMIEQDGAAGRIAEAIRKERAKGTLFKHWQTTRHKENLR